MGARKSLVGIADIAGIGFLCDEELGERARVTTYMHPTVNALGGI